MLAMTSTPKSLRNLPFHLLGISSEIEAISFFWGSDCFVAFDGVYLELPKDLVFIAAPEETVCLWPDTMQLAKGLFILDIKHPTANSIRAYQK
jgi:hypothetical protein